MSVAPYPKHCFHNVSINQFDEDDRCCFCDAPEREYVKSDHGRYYKGPGDLVDRSNEDCPERGRTRSDDGK